jgi:hypothetical protein
MKKPIKISLAIVILIWILYIIGLHKPFVVNRVRKQIKQGQSIDQVIGILSNARQRPDLCCWQIAGTKDPICSVRKNCDFPKDKIMLNSEEQEIQLSVLFIGSSFSHNNFHVMFDSTGKVVSVSDIKRWD